MLLILPWLKEIELVELLVFQVDFQLDLFVSGFVCKLFSGESTTRFKSGDVRQMFHASGATAPVHTLAGFECSRCCVILHVSTACMCANC